MADCMTDLMVDWMADWMAGLLFYFLSVWGLALESYFFFPQTVLALWGSGVFKAGEWMPGFPASRTFPDMENH